MIKEIEIYKRKDLFNLYQQRTNPFIIITTKIEVTNIVNYCKVHRNFYATFGYLIGKTVNNIEEFKYRYNNGKFYYCENIITGYTNMLKNEDIGFFNVPYKDNFDGYIKDYIAIQKEFIEKGVSIIENSINEIWLSCAPWFSFNGLIPPFDKEITIPQFIWDKYEKIEDKYFVNLMIMVHHGFADGYHVGEFINELQKTLIYLNKLMFFNFYK